jgi:hydrogenase nickel incorporation protein HypA/HybF
LHEFGIAQSIVDYAASEVGRKKAARVLEIQVEVGELAMIDRPVLAHALRLLMTGPTLERCRVRINKRKVVFGCRKCSASWPMTEAIKQMDKVQDDLLVREPNSKELPTHFLPSLYPAFVHCPRCGSADLEVKQGEGVVVKRMVLG